MEVKELEMDADTPEMVVISAMTAVTPMVMPSTVRNERRRFWAMLDTDMVKLSMNMVADPRSLRKKALMRSSPRLRFR